MHRILSSFCNHWKLLKQAFVCLPMMLYRNAVYCITWLIPSVEQMSDVQMCMGMLLLLEVRVVGEVSLLLYLCLCANGCFCMYGDRLSVFPFYVLVIVCLCVNTIQLVQDIQVNP